jgi:hypothetical protein
MSDGVTVKFPPLPLPECDDPVAARIGTEVTLAVATIPPDGMWYTFTFQMLRAGPENAIIQHLQARLEPQHRPDADASR